MYFVRDTFPGVVILVEFVKDLHWATLRGSNKLPMATTRSNDTMTAKTMLKRCVVVIPSHLFWQM